MPFSTPIDTLADLRKELNALGASKGGTTYECRQEAKSNYDVVKAAPRGRCTWSQFIIAATVHRADPDPHPRHSPFPHRCGHVGLLVEAREGTTSVCFILDDTVLQWDLPLEASHQPASARQTPYNDYFTNLHHKAIPMNPPAVRQDRPPNSAAHILAEGPDRNMAFNDWGKKIAKHPFATFIDSMEVFSTAQSDGMTP